MKKLDSVGSVIDIKTGMIYPMLANGGYDKGMGSSLFDNYNIDEWLYSLDNEDREIVESVFQLHKNKDRK